MCNMKFVLNFYLAFSSFHCHMSLHLTEVLLLSDSCQLVNY